MRDHPGTEFLLATARRALLERVLPGLQGEAHGTALMVARALAIVMARLQTEARALSRLERGEESEELLALADLLGESATTARRAHGDTNAAILHLSRQLVTRIRSGAFDAPNDKHDELVRFLRDVTSRKLAETNPKVLHQIDLECKETR